MDIKEYISSGIIESYVLGVVSDQERREVECMSKIYPELHQHLLHAQSNLEEIAQSWQKEPPSDLKNKVMSSIQEEANKEKVTPKKQAKMIKLKKSENARGINARSVAATSVIVILAAGALIFMRSYELKKAETKLSTLNEELKKNENLTAELNKKLDASEAKESFLTNSNTVAITLAGTPNSPEAKVKAYWNENDRKVMLTGMSLPQNEIDKQYQLWAIMEGVPVNLGMLNGDNPNLSMMKNVEPGEVDAFAITLEEKGGSETPNLDQLYVIGNV